MKKKVMNTQQIFDDLFIRYPMLEVNRNPIYQAYSIMKAAYTDNKRLFVAGNGGSAADSEHIVGELMKSFLFERCIDDKVKIELENLYETEGRDLAHKLEGALPAIPLTSMPALTSAFANDVDASVSFAQMLYGYGGSGDVLLGITTSGNSKNILYALMVARAKKIKTIVLTGEGGGKSKSLADIAICVPSKETFQIQEYHLPVYHALCAMLEADFFIEKN